MGLACKRRYGGICIHSVLHHGLVVVISLEGFAHARLDGRLDRAERVRLVQFLDHFLLGLIRSLQLLEQRLLLILEFTGDALRSRRLVKTLLNSARVSIRVRIVRGISTHLGVEFGLQLSILDVLVGGLLFAEVLLSVDVDNGRDLVLLVFDFGEGAAVAPLEVASLHLDRVFRARTHLIEARTIVVFGLLIFHMMSRHHFHFLLLDVVHVFDKLLSTLQVLDSLISALFFLQQFDNS